MSLMTDDHPLTVGPLVEVEECMVSGAVGDEHDELYDLGDLVTGKGFCTTTSTNRFR